MSELLPKSPHTLGKRQGLREYCASSKLRTAISIAIARAFANAAIQRSTEKGDAISKDPIDIPAYESSDGTGL